jgi:hypothetical protein
MDICEPHRDPSYGSTAARRTDQGNSYPDKLVPPYGPHHLGHRPCIFVHSARRITTAWAFGGSECHAGDRDRWQAASARALRMPVPRVHDIPASPLVVASVRAVCPTRLLPAPRTYVKRAIHASQTTLILTRTYNLPCGMSMSLSMYQ